MTNWGIVTSRGKPLTPQAIDYLFRNSYYAGILKNPFTGEEHEGQARSRGKPRRLCTGAAGLLDRSRYGVPHRATSPDFPLRGLVRCPDCQRYMTGSLSRGHSKQYAYYRCFADCGNGTSYPAAPIHNEFSGFLAEIQTRPEVVDKLADAIIQTAAERRAATKKKQARLERKIAEITHQMQTLITMRTEDLIDDEEFVAKKRILADRRAAFPSFVAIQICSTRRPYVRTSNKSRSRSPIFRKHGSISRYPSGGGSNEPCFRQDL